ncbi:MAG TPA: argininosuccinate synthase [Marinilabiliales bacterium]|nr:argininosuccinate synthase [Marinilabiliales bacterium]
MTKKKQTVVLAYSGGLDTTYTAKYLSVEKEMDVISVVANTGGFDNDQLSKIEQRAKELGVKEHVALNIEKEYYQDCLRFLIYGNILKNNTYPLSVSSERFFQAKAIAKYAQQVDADFISHGCTAAGNDQVRFDLVFKLMVPEKPIIALVRDKKLLRDAEISYLRKHGVTSDFTKMAYSINEGLWGTSIGGKETLTSHLPLPSEAFPSQPKRTEPLEMEIHFSKGELIGIDQLRFDHQVDMIRYLNKAGGEFAIGRGMHVGDTIIGSKGRVGFEAPAAYLLLKAHHELEKHTLTKWQMQWKEQLANWYGTMLHDGMYLEPTMRNVEHFLEDTQAHVTGTVKLVLSPFYFQVSGIHSEFDLMNPAFGAYGEAAGKWSAEDVKGFINILANPLKNYYAVNPQELQPLKKQP